MTTRIRSMARPLACTLWLAAAVVQAAPLDTGPPVNVSSTPTPTEKAKLARLAYVDAGVFRKAWLFTYLDGPAGRQNIHVRVSFDDGMTWQAETLLSRDAAGAPTGGQVVTTGAGAFTADNDMPMLFAPPVTSKPLVTIAWNSAYCPPDPTAATAGSYASAVQGTADANGDDAPDRPFHCLWVATTSDPALATWNVHQLTNGQRDATNEVVAGSATGNAVGIAWQEDPAGLQPGEAEGHGDGGSGAHVTGGTNIWYTYAPGPVGATLRANIRQLSDNDLAGMGQPGASRPALVFSGSTAMVAYEESACPGGAGGKCIVYHSFPYATPDTDAAGTTMSDVTHNARRVRIVQQGAAAAGTSPLRTVLLWRESAVAVPNAPADIMIRRGLAEPATRAGSTGFLPADLLAEAPQKMTDVAASGGNANAHRAVMRGGSIVLAYDLTPNMAGADPVAPAAPTATYNLFVTRSTGHAAAGTWSAAVNLSGLTSPSVRVVEPRLVPTPGTVVNPLTGKPDPGDQQDPEILYAAYSVEANTPAGGSGQVLVSRSTDFGIRFSPFAQISTVAFGQSESQLRPTPDGTSAAVLWMQEQAAGDAQVKDAMLAVATAPLPDLTVLSANVTTVAGSPVSVRLDIVSKGRGDARKVSLEGTLPAGLTLLGISNAGTCQADGARFSCRLAELPAGTGEPITLLVSAAEPGTYAIDLAVVSADADAQVTDNLLALQLDATTLPPASDTPPPVPSPDSPIPVIPTPGTSDPLAAVGSGGGCTMARSDAPFDPILPALAVLGFASALLRRGRIHCAKEV